MSKLLEQIFDKGYAVKEVSLGETKVKAKFRNLATESQLDIEAELSRLSNKTSAYVLHKYSVGVLSHTLLELNGKKFKTTEEVEETLLKLPTPVCDALIQAQNRFEKEIAAIINPKQVEETFFEKGSTPEKPEQQPVESSSANQGA